MDFVFHILFPLLIVVMLWGGYALVRRTRQRRRAWQSGLSARARVVRAYVRVQTINDVPRRIQYHEYDFTADGRAVRFTEAGGPPSRAVGDETLVYYTSEDPESATASEPAPGRDMAGAVIGLAVITAGVIIAINVMITYG
ncbi:DUF3592 domain-containing protein [Streptomyces sp. N35]|uniref:DUF3592 domain-containing protein n=1 Tax=Streptomyces sp. N35 TaxID=2795730 RepID=UPI0018F34966|nr:DUF3592 domain-containing protein [Streptomyces sp. N35]